MMTRPCVALAIQLRVSGFEVLVFQSGEELLAPKIPTGNACILVDGNELRQSLAAPETPSADDSDERSRG